VQHTKTFTVYTDEGGTSNDIVLFASSPRKLGANCEDTGGQTTGCGTGHASVCADADGQPCFKNFRQIYVCNYGDYNLTVNVTDFTAGSNVYFTTETDGPPAIPQPDYNTTGEVRWYNVRINTSSCFAAEIPYRPTDDTGEETFILQAEWIDPIIGETQMVTSKHVSLISAYTGTQSPTITTTLNRTYAYPNEQLALRAIAKLGGSEGYTSIDGAATQTVVHYVELYIPPGFQRPTNFRVVDNNDATVRATSPDPGYPIGSPEEGWIVKFSPYSVGGTVIRFAAAATASVGNINHYVDFTTTVLPENNITPGGKVFYTNYVGWMRQNKDYLFKTDRNVLSILSPFVKTVRYYNTTIDNEEEGFPSSNMCQPFSVKLQVFNKGNLPATNFNVTENKYNQTVTHWNDLQFSNFNPFANAYSSNGIIWGNNNINFIPTGKDNSRNYTYLITVPYQTNGTFVFKALTRNVTYLFYDKNYTTLISCGAALFVDEPVIKKGELTNPPIYNGDSFNISSSIYNNGPGSATNVIVLINYTANFNVRNSSNHQSNITYIGNISSKETKQAHLDYYYTVNTTGITPGTYTFCIIANATENSTKVASCKDVQIQSPPAIIELENPLVVSKETGTSSGSWGYNFTFNISVRVSNSDTNTNICSYFSKTGSEPWIQIGSCQNYNAPGPTVGSWQNYTYEFDPSCDDIGSPVFVKFNATNNAGTINSTQALFTITKDKIIFENVVGNNTETRRGKTSTLLALRTRDLNGTLVNNLPLTFYVTLDGSIYDAGYTTSTNASAYANYYFQASCSPKYQVGLQKWRAVLSNNNCYQDNNTETSFGLTVNVTGDIILSFVRPDGFSNFTQEQEIPFLGATSDDCNDPLTPTIRYFINKSSTSIECTDISQVGSNAFTCEVPTTINTPMGWYNASMYAIRDQHYTNYTNNLGNPGLFYLYPIKKLLQPYAYPTTEGWGYQNWNFSINVSSGDSENVLSASIYMAQFWPPITLCPSNICLNQTPLECANCIGSTKYWYRNFTAYDQGTWYYQFKLDGTQTEQVLSVTVEKDDTNITYGGEGNLTTLVKDVQPQYLSARVYDLDRQTYNVTNPSATVIFKLFNPGYPEGYIILGTALTNETGYARFLFNITSCYGFYEGTQLWTAEINSSEPYYKPSQMGNGTITIQLPGCQPQIDAEEVLTPKEVFSGRNFTVNVTITAWVASAENVFVTLYAPSGWQVDQPTKSLGTVNVGQHVKISWQVNATSYDEQNFTFYVNSTNANNETIYSEKLVSYKPSMPSIVETLPTIIQPLQSKTFSWPCEVGDYRIANLTALWNGTETKAKLYVYNGTSWIEIAERYLNSTSTEFIPILQNQLNSNETGYCVIKIENIGDNYININQFQFSSYYNQTVKIQDINVTSSSMQLTGIEPNEKINVTVRVGNSGQSQTGVLWLNITGPGGVVNYSSQNVNILAGTSLFYVDNIDTTGWQQGTYSIRAYIDYGNKTERVEPFELSQIQARVYTYDWICNSSIESFIVNLYHPFNDFVQYNISLQLPSGWSYQPSYVLVNATSKGNYTANFSITSSNAAFENTIINATLKYNYPTAKSITLSKQI
ncbi:MAG: hypothetical protein QXF12_05625, partial [Candidatus Aenigmatarchaeota archaeon]